MFTLKCTLETTHQVLWYLNSTKKSKAFYMFNTFKCLIKLSACLSDDCKDKFEWRVSAAVQM